MRDCRVGPAIDVGQVIDLPNPLIGLLRLWIEFRNEVVRAWNFTSPKAYIEERARNFSKSQSLYKGVRARNFYKSQSLYRKEKLGIFQNPKTYIEGERSEFFQVSELI